MGKSNRELPLAHLQAEYKAIRWLFNHGYSFKEIQMFSWSDVDEFEKFTRAKREIFLIKYNQNTGEIVLDKREKDFKIPIDDREVEWFFAHSRIYCHWCFLSKRPLTWRKEKSLDSLFPLCKIEEICSEGVEKPWDISLTEQKGFAKIRVTKTHIEKTETKEQAREAALVN